MIKRRHSLIDNPIAKQDPQTLNDKPEECTDTLDKPADTVDTMETDSVLPVSIRLRRGVPFGR